MQALDTKQFMDDVNTRHVFLQNVADTAAVDVVFQVGWVGLVGCVFQVGWGAMCVPGGLGWGKVFQVGWVELGVLGGSVEGE